MALTFGLNDWRDYHPRNDVNAPIVLCFGDSWFWYPIPGVGNLSNRFLDFGKFQSIDIAAIGESGMEIAKPGKRILFDLTTFLQWESKTVDMILISGGGNDFAGPEDLDPLMKKGNNQSPLSWLKEKETEKLFEAIRSGYDRIRFLRDTYCQNVPIVTHCYDYSFPTGEGLLWFSPWIKPSFDKIGVPEKFRHLLVKEIIDRLAQVQEEMAGEGYIFVDTRKTLKKEDWSNELHPTGAGFNKIAARCHPVFKEKFPDWILTPRWMR